MYGHRRGQTEISVLILQNLQLHNSLFGFLDYAVIDKTTLLTEVLQVFIAYVEFLILGFD